MVKGSIPFAPTNKIHISLLAVYLSGWNIINTREIITYSNSATVQYGKIRFTFGCTEGTAKNYTGLTISNIMGFGGVGWTAPSNMAKLGHLYKWDSSQNATFPAKVTASGGFSGSLSGNATSATKATQDASGNIITDTYATKTELGNKVDKVSGKGLSTNDFTTTLKSKLDGIANNANNYSLPTASSSTKGGVKTGAAITDTTGYTAVHIKDGVIYYKDTNTHLVTSVFGRTGDVSLSKSDVTTALGYTPPTTDTNTTYSLSGAASGNTWITTLTPSIGSATTSTVPAMKAASSSAAGAAGLVPAPASGKQTSFLRGDGTWVVPTNTDTKVTQTVTTSNASYPLLLAPNGQTATATTTSYFDSGVTLNPSNNTINANLNGNAATATKLKNACMISIGNVGSTFDGSSDISFSLSDIGAAAASHGTHVSYGTSASALGTSSAGSASTVSRSDHVHALPALTSCTGTLTIAKGGTGATSKSGARANLGITSGTSLPSSGSTGDIFFLYKT